MRWNAKHLNWCMAAATCSPTSVIPMRRPSDFKALLAARIVEVLDARALSVRKAAAYTGIAAADFSRIRTVELRPLHDRSADDDPRTARPAGRSESQSQANRALAPRHSLSAAMDSRGAAGQGARTRS